MAVFILPLNSAINPHSLHHVFLSFPPPSGNLSFSLNLSPSLPFHPSLYLSPSPPSLPLLFRNPELFLRIPFSIEFLSLFQKEEKTCQHNRFYAAHGNEPRHDRHVRRNEQDAQRNGVGRQQTRRYNENKRVNSRRRRKGGNGKSGI